MKNKIWLWIIILVSVLGTVAIYSQLPAEVPRHWNYNGEVDAMGPKGFVFFTALLPAALYLLLLFIPRIDPKRENYEKHKNAYGVIVAAVVLMMVFVHWVTILATLGLVKDVGLFVMIAVGLLFIFIGNVMPN